MREGPRWISGVIAGIQGPVSYQVRVPNRAVLRQHVHQFRIITAIRLQIVVSPYKSVDLLTATDSETMRGGYVVY